MLVQRRLGRWDRRGAGSWLRAERRAADDLGRFKDVEDTRGDAGVLEVENGEKIPVVAQAWDAEIVYVEAPKGTDEVAIARTCILHQPHAR